jgi:hypothetical protein
MKKKRLAFARKYLRWTSSDWRKVMFSDESTFCQVNPRSVTVRRGKTQVCFEDCQALGKCDGLGVF